jgi:hypothetical protein
MVCSNRLRRVPILEPIIDISTKKASICDYYYIMARREPDAQFILREKRSPAN